MSPSIDTGGVLTIEAVATRVGVSTRTIHRWTQAGTFPKPERVLGRNVWTTDVLDQWEQQEAT